MEWINYVSGTSTSTSINYSTSMIRPGLEEFIPSVGGVTTVLELISDGNKRRQGQQKTSTWDVKTAVEIIEGGSDSPEAALQRSGYALWCIPPQHPVLQQPNVRGDWWGSRARDFRIEES